MKFLSKLNSNNMKIYMVELIRKCQEVRYRYSDFEKNSTYVLSFFFSGFEY